MTETADPILDQAIAEASLEDLAADPCASEPAVEAPPPSDGNFELAISDDRLEAAIVFPPLKGCPRPELRVVLEKLVTRHHLAHIDDEALTAALADAIRSSDAPVRAVVARGAAAVDGDDGRLEWLGDFFESHRIVLPNGSVDHYHHTKVSVYEGQPLVQVHAPGRGTPGQDVCGREIAPAPGKPATIEFDATVRRDERMPAVLLAARSGMVEYARGKLTVSDVQVVEAVGFASGSIDFDGAVNVRDHVDPKFSVYGTGSVVIGGLVENATIESERNLTIDKGVMGHGEAVLRCKGDLVLGFAREATVRCGGRLVARRELLWCDGEIHGDMLCEEGRIIGGHWRVGGACVVDEVGSREEVMTVITLGEAPAQNRALAKLTRDRKLAQQTLEDFRRRYRPFLRAEAGNLPDAEREALEHRAFLIERQASRTRKREYLLRKRLHLQRRSAFLWVKSIVHAGVRVRLNGGDFQYDFVEPRRGPVCVRFDARSRQVEVLSCALEDCLVGMR